MLKNRLQSNSRLTKEGDYASGQTFNFPELKAYNIEEAWNFLRSLNKTTRSFREDLLNNQKSRHTYLVTLPYSVNKSTLNLIKDQIALLEKTFEYTIWLEPNKNLNESIIYYFADEE